MPCHATILQFFLIYHSPVVCVGFLWGFVAAGGVGGLTLVRGGVSE